MEANYGNPNTGGSFASKANTPGGMTQGLSQTKPTAEGDPIRTGAEQDKAQETWKPAGTQSKIGDAPQQAHRYGSGAEFLTPEGEAIPYEIYDGMAVDAGQYADPDADPANGAGATATEPEPPPEPEPSTPYVPIDPNEAYETAYQKYMDGIGPKPEGPSESQGKIDQLYTDLLGRHDENWKGTEEGIDTRAAADRRRAMAANAAAGRGLGGSFLGGQRQANIAMANSLTDARAQHGKEGTDLMKSQLDASLEQGRFDKRFGQEADFFNKGQAHESGMLGMKNAYGRDDREQAHGYTMEEIKERFGNEAEMLEATTENIWGVGTTPGEDGAVEARNGVVIPANVTEHMKGMYPPELLGEMVTHLSQGNYKSEEEYQHAAYEWMMRRENPNTDKKLKAFYKKYPPPEGKQRVNAYAG